MLSSIHNYRFITSISCQFESNGKYQASPSCSSSLPWPASHFVSTQTSLQHISGDDHQATASRSEVELGGQAVIWLLESKLYFLNILERPRYNQVGSAYHEAELFKLGNVISGG